jgi:folate-binding protein YgfZ
LIVSTDFSSRPGAVGDPPEHYGNPLGEQRALAEGRAVVDLSDRGVLSLTGPDRLSWLDSLTSQSLTGLQPGESAETLQLDPQGRVEFAVRVLDDGVTAWLLVDGESTDALLTWLQRMRFMLRVEITDESARFRTVGSLGAESPAAAPNGVPLVWHDPWHAVTPGGWQYARTEAHPSVEWTYTETLVERDADLSSLPVAGSLALEALRVAAWRPRAVTEVDATTIPHELDWLRSAVHLSKGCYRGQETVAKVHNLGHPPRRLVMLHLDGSDAVLPPAGSEVRHADAVVGRVTTSAVHYELGPVALAVVKRSLSTDAPLAIPADGIEVAAAQEAILPTDAGATASVPRIPRLGSVR